MEAQIFSSDLSQYAEAVSAIKEAITRCRYRSLAAANSNLLSLYFGVGRYVSQNSRDGKWGQKAIPTISALLQKEMPGLRGFSETGIRRMRIFYEEWSEVIFHPTALDELENKENRPSLMGEIATLQIRPSVTDVIRPTLLDELQVHENLLLESFTHNIDWSEFLSISFSHRLKAR